MRLGKRERAALKVKLRLRKRARSKAREPEPRMRSMWDYFTPTLYMVGKPARAWEYDGRVATRLHDRRKVRYVPV